LCFLAQPSLSKVFRFIFGYRRGIKKFVECIFIREVCVLKWLPMIFKKFFLAEGFSDALFETGGVLCENAKRNKVGFQSIHP